MFISGAHLTEVFFTKLVFNLKSEASKTYLNYLWWILEPALLVGVFYIVFGVFLARGGEDFLVFLICGHIPFAWFSKSVSNAANSILDGRYLISQIAIPKPFFPMLVVFQDAVKQAVVFALMFVFLVMLGVHAGWAWLGVVPVILTQFLFICGIAMVVAAITPLIPDFVYLVATAMTMLMFGSGIFYNYTDVLLPEHQKLFLMNPVASLIMNYRQVLMDNQPPDWGTLSSISIVSIAVILIMTVFYRRFGTMYARLVLQ